MRKLVFVALLLAASVRTSAAVPLPPKPERYVTDRAGILDSALSRELNEKLAEFERQTSNQVIVYVDRRMPESTTLEEVANAAFHEWKIGQKGTSNGVLFLVFTEDRKMRIEVGRGLEGILPDVLAGRILREQVRPKFASGAMAGGIEDGVNAILATVRGEGYKGTGSTAAETGRQQPDAWGWAIFIGFFVCLFGGVGMAIFAISRKIRRDGFRSFVSYGTTYSSGGSDWSSSDGGSSSGDSGGGSDFSGGGGDSGGGGASDSW